MDDFLANLDAEIGEIVAKEQKLRDVEKLRKKSHNQRLPKTERDEAKTRYQELTKELHADLWEPVSEAVLFLEQSCTGCGSKHRIFLQFMEKLRHKRMPQVHWQRVIRPTGTLPQETILQHHETHICADCACDHGFHDDQAVHLKTRGLVLPSTTYQPDDINSQFEEGDYDAPCEED